MTDRPAPDRGEAVRTWGQPPGYQHRLPGSHPQRRGPRFLRKPLQPTRQPENGRRFKSGVQSPKRRGPFEAPSLCPGSAQPAVS